MKTIISLVLLFFTPLLSIAEDEPIKLKELKTAKGVIYSDVIIKSVSADEISIIHAGGARTIAYDDIPKEIREEIGMQSLREIKDREEKEKAERKKKAIEAEKLKKDRILAREEKMVLAYKNFQFGNSYSRVIEKIEANDSITLKSDKQKKEISNTIYAETKLGGIDVNLFFAFIDNALVEMIFMTPPEDASNYSTSVKKSHDLFLKILASKYPQPSFSFGYPEFGKLEKNRIFYSYVWKFSGKHLKLGVGTSDTQYSAYIAIKDSDTVEKEERKKLEESKNLEKDAESDF